MSLRKFFDTDVNGHTVEPNRLYVVQLHPRNPTDPPMQEYVSGEDLLACADFVDQLMTGHEWIPSTLGHGNMMCKHCLMTDLEAKATHAYDSVCNNRTKKEMRHDNT